MNIFKSRVNKIIFLLISFAVISVEIALSLFGPMATLDMTTVIVSPIYKTGTADEIFIENLNNIIKSHMVRTGSFTMVRQIRFEEYFNKHPEEVKKYQPYRDYLKIAHEAGIEKLLTASLYGSEINGYKLHLTLRDTETDIMMKRDSFQFDSLENLEKSTEIIDTFSFSAKRISVFDLFFLILLIMQCLFTILIIFDKNPTVLLESAIVLNIVLFLFSWFFARNANMDYFQKFVATRGQVTIAQDTTTEQLYAFIRFLPTFLISSIIYLKLTSKKSINRYALILTIISAVFYSLSFPNQLTLKGFPVMAYFALVPLFLVLNSTGFRKGIFYGSTFGIIQAILINFWQGTYSYIGLQLVTIGLFIEYFIFMIVLSIVIKISGKWRLIAIPLLWCFFEYTRSIGYIGYPWGLIGTSQFAFTSFIQLASVTGVWGLSLLLLYFNSAITWMISGKMKNRKLYFYPLIIFSLTVLSILAGRIRIQIIDSIEADADETRTIIIVQQNRDPRKHSYQQSLDFAIETTDMAIEELGESPDLVLWSEGAFKPDIRWHSDESRREFKNGKLVTQLTEYTASIGAYVITGTQDHIFIEQDDKQIRRNFNSSALLNPDGSINDIYHKMKLVPFTEHFPYKEQLPWMWEFLQKFDTSNWLAGSERKILHAGDLEIFTPICFEDAFPDHIRKYVLNGGNIIANISNDYWSLSPVEGMQHGINGLFRSVENRRPMFRATCSGYTVYADSMGRIQGEVEEFYEKGYIIARIAHLERPFTLYTKFGDWLPLSCILILTVFILLRIILWGYHRFHSEKS